MIYPLRDKKQIARKKKTLRTVVWVVIFFIIVTTGALAWTGRIFVRIGRPIWRAQEIVTDAAKSVGYVARTKASVYAENENLLQENADLKNSMLDYTILKKENDDLKSLVGRLPTDHTFVLGTILSRPNSSPYDTIIIDVGRSTGITTGMYVFANAETPIGEISNVYANTSVVTLYSNPGRTTEAMLDGSNATVELVGRGGGNFEMSVPLDLSADKGTMVVLPSVQSQIVAVVEDIISTPTDPLKKVLLRTPVNIQNLKWVQVRKE